MPTKRRRRERFRRPDVDPVHWALLTDDIMPADGNPFAQFSFDKVAPALWERYREVILADWLETKPGTRPQHWWLFEAPRLKDLGEHSGNFYADRMIEPRRLLKGHGRPAWEVLAIVPCYHLGIPADWTGGDVRKLVFESQYDYLSRHGLLEPGEGKSKEPVFIPEREEVLRVVKS